MDRPSKKEIKAAVDALKDKSSAKTSASHDSGKLTPKKSSMRIRKQGV